MSVPAQKSTIDPSCVNEGEPVSQKAFLQGLEPSGGDLEDAREIRKRFTATSLVEWNLIGDALVTLGLKPSDLDSVVKLSQISGGLKHIRKLLEELRPLSLRLRE